MSDSEESGVEGELNSNTDEQLSIANRKSLKLALRDVAEMALANGVPVDDVEAAFEHRADGIEYQAEELRARQQQAALQSMDQDEK